IVCGFCQRVHQSRDFFRRRSAKKLEREMEVLRRHPSHVADAAERLDLARGGSAHGIGGRNRNEEAERWVPGSWRGCFLDGRWFGLGHRSPASPCTPTSSVGGERRRVLPRY